MDIPYMMQIIDEQLFDQIIKGNDKEVFEQRYFDNLLIVLREFQEDCESDPSNEFYQEQLRNAAADVYEYWRKFHKEES